MRVECHSIEGFLQELQTEAEAGRIWKQIVRVEIDRHPEQADETTFRVAFHASALVGDAGGAEELLHFDGAVGRDGFRGRMPSGERADPEAGSKRAVEWRNLIEDFAGRGGLQVRPGKFELV